MKVIREKKAPDFLIVGAAKSGTTSLWYYLNQHPDIFMNQGVKELGYFSKYYGINDFDEYLKYFDDAEPHQMIGEACHSYLSSVESAKRIYDFNPRMKIMMMLRNPVHRAYSLYNWMVQHGWEKATSFEEALIKEEALAKDSEFKETNKFYYMNYLYCTSGFYYEQVKRYIEIFPKENIHIMIYEAFRQDNLSCVHGILKFLNVKDWDGFDLEKQNESLAIRSPRMFHLLMHHFTFLSDKYYIPRKISSPVKHWLIRYNRLNKRPDKLNKATELQLFKRYEDDITKLSDLIKIDLFKYWKVKEN